MQLFVKNTPLSDDALILKYKANDDPALIGILFERYSHLVVNMCFKYLKDEEESKDAMMEIFQSLMESVKEHTITNFKSWLYSVSRNHCLMKIRKQTIVKVEFEENEEFENNFMENGGFLHLNSEDNLPTPDDVIDAMNQLEKDQKQCIELFYLEEKSYQEIAEITGFNNKQVKSYLQNGKRNLKNILQQKAKSHE